MLRGGVGREGRNRIEGGGVLRSGRGTLGDRGTALPWWNNPGFLTLINHGAEVGGGTIREMTLGFSPVNVGDIKRLATSGNVVEGEGSGDQVAQAENLGRGDARHSGLVRCFGRVFGNEGAVERDRGADPARNGPTGGGFGARSRVATVAGSARERQWRRSRRDGSEPPRLDFGGDQQRLYLEPLSWIEVAHSRSSRGSGSGNGDQ